MIPILYDTGESAFTSNGLGRLRDCISCVVTEERNGIYECDFEYPVGGVRYEDIQVGRIIGVVTDDTGDFQPFDIVSFTRPINGVVEFHCTHISYRQSYLTVTGKSINSLADALALLERAQPNNPFTYDTDKASTGYLACADGVPRSVRTILGGVEGSILDAYGGEYEWDKFHVILHSERGVERDFSIRYGVNMLNYNEEFDVAGIYSSCIPYWTDGTNTVVGDKQDSLLPTITGRGECVPLDVSDKFETLPTKAQVEEMGASLMNTAKPMIPSQSIHIEFARLQDMGYEELKNLLTCGLCDTINVVFPFYNTVGKFKIVKTIWNVLANRYESMELGDLSVTFAEALGITYSNGGAVSTAVGGGMTNTLTSTITSFSSGWSLYDDTAASKVKLRKNGKIVTLTGALTNTSAITLNATESTVFTIPTGFRPSQNIVALAQGSTTNIFCVRVNTSGAVTFERYRNTTSYQSIAAGAWFPFHITWIMD